MLNNTYIPGYITCTALFDNLLTSNLYLFASLFLPVISAFNKYWRDLKSISSQTTSVFNDSDRVLLLSLLSVHDDWLITARTRLV